MPTTQDASDLHNGLTWCRLYWAYLCDDSNAPQEFRKMVRLSSGSPRRADPKTLPDVENLQDLSDLDYLGTLVDVSRLWPGGQDECAHAVCREPDWIVAADKLLKDVRGRLQAKCAVMTDDDVVMLIGHLAATSSTLIRGAELMPLYQGDTIEENRRLASIPRPDALNELDKLHQSATKYARRSDKTSENAETVHDAYDDAYQAAIHSVKAFDPDSEVGYNKEETKNFALHLFLSGIDGLATHAKGSDEFIMSLAMASRVSGCNLLEVVRSKGFMKYTSSLSGMSDEDARDDTGVCPRAITSAVSKLFPGANC